MRYLLLPLLILMLAAPLTAIADGHVEVVKPKGETCVEPVEDMRRNHMAYLMHQRDLTVIDGIRTKQHSLVGCMNCHNPAYENQPVVRYEDPQHFCALCHRVAAVKLDCFECHADREVIQVQQSMLLEAEKPVINQETLQRYQTNVE